MTDDIKKVTKALRICSENIICGECSYRRNDLTCINDLMAEALQIIEEQQKRISAAPVDEGPGPLND